MCLLLWKKPYRPFGQPDTIISISLSPGMILSSSSQTPEPFLGPQFTLIMVSRSVITPLSTSLSTFFLDLHLFILSLDHLIDILTSWNHSLLFRRPSWGGGGLHLQSPAPRHLPWMRISLPRHDLLGEERWPADLSKEKGQEPIPQWAFIGFNLHRNTGHKGKAH